MVDHETIRGQWKALLPSPKAVYHRGEIPRLVGEAGLELAASKKSITVDSGDLDEVAVMSWVLARETFDVTVAGALAAVAVIYDIEDPNSLLTWEVAARCMHHAMTYRNSYSRNVESDVISAEAARNDISARLRGQAMSTTFAFITDIIKKEFEDEVEAFYLGVHGGVANIPTPEELHTWTSESGGCAPKVRRSGLCADRCNYLECPFYGVQHKSIAMHLNIHGRDLTGFHEQVMLHLSKPADEILGIISRHEKNSEILRDKIHSHKDMLSLVESARVLYLERLKS
jgi:Zn-finger protein